MTKRIRNSRLSAPPETGEVQTRSIRRLLGSSKGETPSSTCRAIIPAGEGEGARLAHLGGETPPLRRSRRR